MANRSQQKAILMREGFAWFDDFTTPRAAGSVNGTASEPGPGTRIIDADSGSNISIADGAAKFAGGTSAWNATRLRLSTAIIRKPGVVAAFKVSTAETSTFGAIGLFNSSTVKYWGFQLSSTSRLVIMDNTSTGGVARVVGEYAIADYLINVILRVNGAFYLIKGGAFTDWTLLWPGVNGNDATLYAAAESFSAAYNVDYTRQPRASINPPAPVASDSFNRANGAIGTTDGAGHPEANGGGSLTWTNRQGTWAIASNKAYPATAGGEGSISTVDCGEADVVMETELTTTGAYVGIVLRYADDDNYVRCIANTTTITLRKQVGGSDTVLFSVAYTYSAGARLVVVADGSKFRVFYNEALISTEQTIADAALQSVTAHGLMAVGGTGSAINADNLVIWARR